MPVTVKGTSTTVVSNAAQCDAYLQSVIESTVQPFTRHTRVRITSRAGMPADVGAMDIGLMGMGRASLPIVSLLVLTTDGLFTMISVPKTNIARWT